MVATSVNRRFAVLALGEGLARGAAFGASVWLARTLGPAGYGVVGVAMAMLLYFSALTDAGLETLGIREVAEDEGRVHTVIPALLGARMLIALVGLAILAAGAHLLLPAPDRTVVSLFGLILVVLALDTRWIALGLAKPVPASVSRVFGELTMAVLVFGLVSGPGDITVVPLAAVVGNAVAAGIMAWWLSRTVGAIAVRFDWSIAGPVLRRSLPLAIHSILGLLIFNADILLLRWLKDSATVGQYVAAYTLISFTINLSVAYGQTLLPSLTALNRSEAEQHALYRRSMLQIGILAVPFSLGGWFLGVEVLTLVFGPAYRPAGHVLALLALSLPASLWRMGPQTLLIAHNRQDVLVPVTAISAVVNLVLNLILIPRYGASGAAGATVVTEVLRTILVSWEARRRLLAPATYAWRPLLIPALGLGALWGFVQMPILPLIGIGAVLYVVLLWAGGTIRLARGDGGPGATAGQ